jgi:type I restriction enzyme S subunit
VKKQNLADLCNIVIGRTPSRSISEYWGEGYPWVSISDLKTKFIEHTKEEITQIAIEKIKCRLIPKGTLLFSFKLSIGKMAFASRALYTNEAIAGLIVKEPKKVIPEYLYYALKETKLLGSNQAAMGKTLNSKSLAVIKVPTPEKINDQIRIATLLSRVEALINTRKDNLRLLDDFLKSTFLDMFGDPVCMKNKDLEPLGKHIKFLTSGSRGWAKYYADEGSVFLRINNVRDATLKLDDIVFVNPPDSAESIRTRTEENDLLLSITADLGRTGVVTKELAGAYINQHLALLRLNCVFWR